jgi:glucosamine 6-phosphate synthetase-like amidotransferase/phosphosugar isomerase protein
MCGIVGYVGQRSAVSVLVPGLRRLEYRGYDSAGMATIDGTSLDVRKVTGKIAELEVREGYPAGEMKHGPIALIDRRCPVIAIAPRDATYDKMTSNMEEVQTRDGLVIAVPTEGDEEIAARADGVIRIPPCQEWLQPFLVALPLQLLAYYLGVLRGCDVDQPRNLAKSVTVE